MGRVHLGGVVASAALVLVAVALAFFGSRNDPSGSVDREPRLVSTEELAATPAEVEHAVYWAAQRPPTRLELTVEADGSVYIRYRSPGKSGADRPESPLTVGSYPVEDALAATRAAAVEEGATLRHLPGGAVAFQDPRAGRSAYLAFPGEDVQVEVFDPQPGKALALVRAGEIEQVGE